jgi:hypothetical protein
MGLMGHMGLMGPVRSMGLSPMSAVERCLPATAGRGRSVGDVVWTITPIGGALHSAF